MSKVRVPKFVVLNKKRGETPLESIQKWKDTHSEFLAVPASYAGRLDPMAEGKLLVLLGDECKKQSSYTKLDKEYEVEVLLDVQTDTGDILGMPTLLATRTMLESKNKIIELQKVIKHETGRHSRRYPIFSSKTVHGKPLFLYALEGTLGSIKIPEHIEELYCISHLSTRALSSKDLEKELQELLSVVPRSDEASKALGADFRQDVIREAWKKVFLNMSERSFTILKLRVTCGSGAYMRTLAERIGAGLGTTGLAFSIRRTRLGKYASLGPLHFWLKTF